MNFYGKIDVVWFTGNFFNVQSICIRSKGDFDYCRL